jgi:hypothetical protein
MRGIYAGRENAQSGLTAGTFVLPLGRAPGRWSDGQAAVRPADCGHRFRSSQGGIVCTTGQASRRIAKLLLIAATGALLAARGTSAEPTVPAAGASLSDAPSLTLQQLERTFWTCDYLATHFGTAGDTGTCASAYQLLKERKFGGRFDDLLRWWQDNKAVQHARLATARPRP